MVAINSQEIVELQVLMGVVVAAALVAAVAVVREVLREAPAVVVHLVLVLVHKTTTLPTIAALVPAMVVWRTVVLEVEVLLSTNSQIETRQ